MPTTYQPHWMCLLGQPLLISLHVAADLLTFVAYAFISSLLFQAKHNPLVFRALGARIQRGVPGLSLAAGFNDWVFIAFATFIGACGLTHLFDIIVLWYPLYWLQAFVKIVTALASSTTAFILARIITSYIRVARVQQVQTNE